jgi:hypothetical protein
VTDAVVVSGAVDQAAPLPPTANPRPDGDGWRLIEYNWEAGIGTLQYRRVGSGEKRTVQIQQPAHSGHAGWNDLHPSVRRAKGAAAAEAARFRPERALPRRQRGQA